MMKKSSLIAYTLSAGTTGLISRGALAVGIFNNSGETIRVNGGQLVDGASLNLQIDGYRQDEIKYNVPAAATGVVQIFEVRDDQ